MNLILRPSSARIWTKCPAQPRIAATVPTPPQSDPAREGTCAAWLAEQVVKGKVNKCADLLGEQHPDNGWLIEPVMVRHIQAYVDMLKGYDGKIDVERSVKLNENIQGTPDAYGLVNDNHLIVDDLKYGYEIVEPTSEQLTIYGGALYRQLTANGHSVDKITLGIYQPRAYHFAGIHRTRDLTPEQLMQEIAVIEQAGIECNKLHAETRTGSHCRYCPGAAKCASVAWSNYDTYHSMHHRNQRNMTPLELAEELAFIDNAEAKLKGRRDAVHAEVNALMDQGVKIPGWVREHGVGQRRWKYNATTVKMLTGIDPTAGKMVTPAELERKGADAELIKNLVITPKTKAKLKPLPDGFFASKFGK